MGAVTEQQERGRQLTSVLTTTSLLVWGLVWEHILDLCPKTLLDIE